MSQRGQWASTAAIGKSATHEVSALYNFATMGGVVSTISLLATVPARAVILDGMIDVVGALTSAGGATVSLGAEAAGDLVLAVVLGSWGLGRHDIIPVGSAATSVKTTADRVVSIVVAVADLTAGKFRVTLRYMQSEA